MTKHFSLNNSNIMRATSHAEEEIQPNCLSVSGSCCLTTTSSAFCLTNWANCSNFRCLVLKATLWPRRLCLSTWSPTELTSCSPTWWTTCKVGQKHFLHTRLPLFTTSINQSIRWVNSIVIVRLQLVLVETSIHRWQSNAIIIHQAA